MATTTRSVLARLWLLQSRTGLRDATVARRIRVSPSYLSHLRRRIDPNLGTPIVAKLLQAFPELKERHR